MEQDVFLRPAVAGKLETGFVEARLHVDIQRDLTDAQFEQNRAVRDRLVDTKAMPTFVIIDPSDEETVIVTGLSGAPTEWEGLFVEFLSNGQQAVAKKGEKAAAGE